MLDLDNITFETLSQKHPDRLRWEQKWQDHRLLYRGGDEMLRAAGQIYISRAGETTQAGALTVVPSAFNNRPNRRFLWQMEGEPNPVYFARWNRASYIGYMPAQIDFFKGWLFSQPPTIKPKEGDEYPDWWQGLHTNATGGGLGLVDFMRDRFLDVCLYRRAGWLLGKADSVAETDDDNRVVLTDYSAEDIWDWEQDSRGDLEWIIIGKKVLKRQFPDLRRQVETFTYLDRQSWKSWEVIQGAEATKLEVIGEGEHNLSRVPFVFAEVPNGLWIADKLASWQIALFNKLNMLENAQLLGCILQPFIKSNDIGAESRIIGESILFKLRLGASGAAGGREGDEDFGWKSPDTAPLEFIAKQYLQLRDEGYRIIHQMALAVDSQAIGAIARSGASKIEDRRASEIILAGYGTYVRDWFMKTLSLMSDIQGDGTEWVCDGFDNFQISTLDEEIQIAALAQTMNFKSKTARKLLELKVVNRLLDKEDEGTKETIEQETEDGYEQEAEDVPPQAAAGFDQPTVPNPDQDGIKNLRGLGLPQQKQPPPQKGAA